MLLSVCFRGRRRMVKWIMIQIHPPGFTATVCTLLRLDGFLYNS
jgi:hypothetical protein